LRHKMAQEERKIISGYAIDIQHLEWYQHQLNIRLNGGRVETEKRQFVRACPVADCRGFLSTAWKCGMCDNWTCPDCHEARTRRRITRATPTTWRRPSSWPRTHATAQSARL
jgi:hypothetical protein